MSTGVTFNEVRMRPQQRSNRWGTHEATAKIKSMRYARGQSKDQIDGVRMRPKQRSNGWGTHEAKAKIKSMRYA
eukprot:scaffold19999_cov17-Tisochrysis_lutea.AAC.2